MGWADCGTDDDGRPIGYAFAATCDEPGCDAEIDRGLSYCCGSMHGGGEHGCGRYFCPVHLRCCFKASDHLEELCRECAERYEAEHPDDD